MKTPRKVRIVLFGVLLLIVVAVSLVLLKRDAIWRSFPSLRFAISSRVLNDRSVVGLTKDAVISKLGPCDKKSEGYAVYWFSPKQVGLPGLIFKVDAAHQISSIYFSHKDFTPPEKMTYKTSAWTSSSGSDQIAMSADFIEKWKSGELRNKFSNLEDVLRDFPGTTLIDHWLYRVSDWNSVIVQFAPDGTVSNILAGGDD